MVRNEIIDFFLHFLIKIISLVVSSNRIQCSQQQIFDPNWTNVIQHLPSESHRNLFFRNVNRKIISYRIFIYGKFFDWNNHLNAFTCTRIHVDFWESHQCCYFNDIEEVSKLSKIWGKAVLSVRDIKRTNLFLVTFLHQSTIRRRFRWYWTLRKKFWNRNSDSSFAAFDRFHTKFMNKELKKIYKCSVIFKCDIFFFFSDFFDWSFFNNSISTCMSFPLIQNFCNFRPSQHEAAVSNLSDSW